MWEDFLEKEMATYSIILAEKSHGQRSLTVHGVTSVRHDLATKPITIGNLQFLLGIKLQTNVLYVYAKSLQSYRTLCNPMDCSPPGSSVHGIFQARIQEWGTLTPSRGSSRPRDQTCISYVSCIGRQILLPLAPLGNP